MFIGVSLLKVGRIIWTIDIISGLGMISASFTGSEGLDGHDPMLAVDDS